MAHRARRLGPALAILALSACNALSGLDDDYHLKAVVQQPVDGGSDGDLADGPVGIDGGPDAPPPRDATVDGRFCETIDAANVAFCSDFEEPDAGASSTLFQNAADGSVGVVADAGLGGTGALVVSLARSAGAGSSQVWFAKTLAPTLPSPGAYHHYEVELSVRTSTTALFYAALAILTFRDDPADNAEYGVALYQTLLSKLKAASGGPESKGEWHRVKIVLDRAGASTAFTRTLTIDGVVIDDGATYTPPATGTSELRLGTFSTSTGTGSLTAWFDQVVVRRW